MADLKRRGDLAELSVAADLVRRGYKIAFPFGEDHLYDLVVLQADRFQRVQVKYARSRDGSLVIRACTLSLTNGKVRQVTRYTTEHIDCLAAYDATTGRIFYVPATELGIGLNSVTLRLSPARNNQRIGTRAAERYVDPPFG
jgi:hypothetical protein